MRLQDALALAGAEHRKNLRERRSIAIDPRMRIDEMEQMARALVQETDLRQSRFPPEVRALLHRLVAAGGILPSGAQDPGATLLCELGIAYRLAGTFTLPGGKPTNIPEGALVLPSCFLVQVPASDGDDPRSLRVLLSFVEGEMLGHMANHVLNRPVALPAPLALQEVWESLAPPGALESVLASLAGAESRLLDAIERAGSEVTTEELLAADQTPGLYRTAVGIAVPKRGAPHMLQRRGLLFAVGIDRFVLPSEVARLVGASRRQERAARRQKLLATVASDDFAPRRARYARDPSLATAAALCLLRHGETPLREDAGLPRGAVRRIAERLGEREEKLLLLVALGRAAGLGRLLALEGPVPGSLESVTVSAVGNLVRDAWRRGGAWDETRVEPELARGATGDRSTSAALVLRLMTLDALEELARDRWVPVELLVRFILEDHRIAGARRIHERARRERPGIFRESIEEAVRLMLTESVPAVGLVDLAEDGSAVRMVQRDGQEARKGPLASVVPHGLEVASSAPLASLLALADVLELDTVVPEQHALLFNANPSEAVLRARMRSLDAEAMGARLGALGLSGASGSQLAAILDGLGNTRSVGYVPVGGALLVEDPGLRAELLTDSGLRRMFLELDAGAVLLLRAEADLARVEARLTRMGVRLRPHEAGMLVAEGRSPSEPPAAESGARHSSLPPPPDGTGKRRSVRVGSARPKVSAR